MNFKIVPIEINKKSRFTIIDDDGVIIDCTNGYGFKSIRAAERFIWWKFQGGKEKLEQKETTKKEYHPACTDFPDAPF